MLQPTDRRLLFDALSPPASYRLDFAVGTSYTLDLFAMLSAPVAFAFSDWQDRDGRPTKDPLALLKAVREYADRICLFFQAGRIQVPHNYQPLLASVESSLVEVLAPRGGSFHPKVWILRFVGIQNKVMYRFLCLSRNMTFDRAWDTMLCLEGPVTDRSNAYTQNHPLGHFLEALPGMAIRGVTKTWKKRIKDLAYEIRRVDFDKPDLVEHLQFWPIGIDADSDPEEDWPFGESTRTLVISPFIGGTTLTDFAGANSRVELVSRAEQLERIKPEILSAYSNVWILDDTAEPEPSEIEVSSTEVSESNEETLPTTQTLVGLHAKLYVLDNGWEASVFTGSANATHAAFNRNVEFLTELRGKKSRLGVAAILGESTEPDDKKPGAASLADLLRPFKPSEGISSEESSEIKFGRLVEEIAKQVAKAQLVAECQQATDDSGFSIQLRPSRKTKLALGLTVSISVRPASRLQASAVPLLMNEPAWATFSSLAMLRLTSFFVFSVETESPKKISREFALNIPLINEPSGRREALLKHLLMDKERVLRFLMLLLSDADATAFTNLFNGTNENSDSFRFSTLLDGPTLFESLMKCADRDPSRLQQVAEIINDLQKSSDGRELLPEELESIWRPIWNVAQRKLAIPSKGW